MITSRDHSRGGQMTRKASGMLPHCRSSATSASCLGSFCRTRYIRPFVPSFGLHGPPPASLGSNHSSTYPASCEALFVEYHAGCTSYNAAFAQHCETRQSVMVCSSNRSHVCPRPQRSPDTQWTLRPGGPTLSVDHVSCIPGCLRLPHRSMAFTKRAMSATRAHQRHNDNL